MQASARFATVRLVRSPIRSTFQKVRRAFSKPPPRSVQLYSATMSIPDTRRNVVSDALPVQTFAGNPLDRSAGNKKDVDFLSKTAPGGRFLPVKGGKVAVDRSLSSARLLWLTLDQIQQAPWHLKLSLQPSTDQTSATESPLTPYVLGQEPASLDWRFSVDVPADAQLEPGTSPFSFEDLRSLTYGRELSEEEMAIAGQAVALHKWHAKVKFCGTCGTKTAPIEGGIKRACPKCKARFYPRVDPVIIVVVISSDNQRCLLGRYYKSAPGMYTALAGFAEQGEGVEEAVRREVLEESNIRVSSVQFLGTQPWPGGRGGSCELMLGCIARADSEDVKVDKNEMEDARWFTRAEVADMLERSLALPAGLPSSSMKLADNVPAPLWVPPPSAIAHHLIQWWADNKEGTLPGLHRGQSAML